MACGLQKYVTHKVLESRKEHDYKMKAEYSGKNIWKAVRAIILGFLAFIVLYPFIWMLVTSFKAEADIVSYPPRLFSGSFGFESYIGIWDRIPFL